MYHVPDNFLRGTAQCPFSWRHDVPINRALPSSDWAALDCFRWRAGEFLSNVEDLSIAGVLEGSTMLHPGDGARTQKGRFFTNTWPGRFRVKSVFMDFRPLILNKGPDSQGNFYRTKNIVCRSTDDATLRAFATMNADGFLAETKELSVDSHLSKDDRNVSVEWLLKLWFNTFYFHRGTSDQSRKADELMAIFEKEGVEQLLFFELLRLAHNLQCMFAIVQFAVPSNPHFSCPDARLVRNIE